MRLKTLLLISLGIVFVMKSDTFKARGLRNNNPGNLEKNGIQWEGLSEEQTDPRFYQFISPEWGIRAMARVLMTYYSRYGINTVEGIVNRWAPPHENDTQSYIDHVSQVLGIAPDEPFVVVDNLLPLVELITIHENGENPYTHEKLLEGIELA